MPFELPEVVSDLWINEGISPKLAEHSAKAFVARNKIILAKKSEGLTKVKHICGVLGDFLQGISFQAHGENQVAAFQKSIELGEKWIKTAKQLLMGIKEINGMSVRVTVEPQEDIKNEPDLKQIALSQLHNNKEDFFPANELKQIADFTLKIHFGNDSDNSKDVYLSIVSWRPLIFEKKWIKNLTEKLRFTESKKVFFPDEVYNTKFLISECFIQYLFETNKLIKHFLYSAAISYNNHILEQYNKMKKIYDFDKGLSYSKDYINQEVAVFFAFLGNIYYPFEGQVAKLIKNALDEVKGYVTDDKKRTEVSSELPKIFKKKYFIKYINEFLKTFKIEEDVEFNEKLFEHKQQLQQIESELQIELEKKFQEFDGETPDSFVNYKNDSVKIKEKHYKNYEEIFLNFSGKHPILAESFRLYEAEFINETTLYLMKIRKFETVTCPEIKNTETKKLKLGENLSTSYERLPGLERNIENSKNNSQRRTRSTPPAIPKAVETYRASTVEINDNKQIINTPNVLEKRNLDDLNKIRIQDENRLVIPSYKNTNTVRMFKQSPEDKSSFSYSKESDTDFPYQPSLEQSISESRNGGDILVEFMKEVLHEAKGMPGVLRQEYLKMGIRVSSAFMKDESSEHTNAYNING